MSNSANPAQPPQQQPAPPSARGAGNVEFVVKPREDLYLEGAVRKEKRVSNGEPYSCQMGKTQVFSCLFRHYAKHNGLRKEDLVFYFTDELKSDETPETVHLMPNDEIWVERRKHDKEEDEEGLDNGTVFEQYRSVLPDGMLAGEHSDVKFVIVQDGREVSAHKVILLVRSEYFRAMFKSGGMRECEQTIFHVKDYSYDTFSRMIEYIYTNTIRDIEQCSSKDVMDLLTLANEYVLSDMKAFCVHAAKLKLSYDNLCDFLQLSVEHNAEALKYECQRFIRENDQSEHLKDVIHKDEELKASIGPIGLAIFDAMACYPPESDPTQPRKRRRSSTSPGSKQRRVSRERRDILTLSLGRQESLDSLPGESQESAFVAAAPDAAGVAP